MRNTLVGVGRAISTGFRPRPVSAATWWAAIGVLLTLLATDARAQEVLRWKLNTGLVLRYKTEQTTRVSVKVQGREPKQRRKQTVYYTWTVTNVSSEGVAGVAVKIDRLLMNVEVPPFMPFQWDSSKPNTEVPEPFEPEVKTLKASVGAEFSFDMKPSGQVENIKIPEQTLKAMRDALPPEAAKEGQFSEEILKNMVMQSSPPPFPEGPVEPGKSWSSPPARLPTPQWTLITDKDFTYQGPDPKSPKLAIIAVQAKVALEPAENSKGTIKIRAQDGKGTLTFDTEAGRVVSSTSTQKLEMVISDMGQQFEQNTESTSDMTLEP
jgi:Family of unknown function (DUF6263)